jgi:hypothetical protein
MKKTSNEKKAALMLQMWYVFSLVVTLTFWLSVLLHFTLGGDYLYETFIVEALDTLLGIIFMSVVAIVIPGITLFLEVKDRVRAKRSVFSWLSCGFTFLTAAGIFWIMTQTVF